MVKPVTPEIEVLVALGAWTLRQARGRPDLLDDIRRDVLSRYEGHYPHQKLLAHWCAEAQEAPEKDVTPAVGTPSNSAEAPDMTVGELIERLYFFPSGMTALGQVGETISGNIIGIEEDPDGVVLKIEKTSALRG